MALLATRRLTGHGTLGRDRLSPGVTASCFLLASVLLWIFGFLLRSTPAVPPPPPSCSVVCNVSTGPVPGPDPSSGPVLTVLVVYAAMAAGALVLLAARRLTGYGIPGRDRLPPGVTASCFLLASAPLAALIVSGAAVPIAPTPNLTWTTPLSDGSVSAAPLVAGAAVAGCLAVAAGYGLVAALRRVRRRPRPGALCRVLDQVDRGGASRAYV